MLTNKHKNHEITNGIQKSIVEHYKCRKLIQVLYK